MPQLLVIKKLNKRSKIPATLPDVNNIVDTVQKGQLFFGSPVTGQALPAAPLDKWYTDEAGYYYWGGAVQEVQTTGSLTVAKTTAGELTALQLKYATGATPKTAEKFLSCIADACTTYSINTPVRQICFLSQLGHESIGLFYTEEIASGKAYENRTDLGNTSPGDGMLYKGRGLIQITGKANYKALSSALHADFVANPALLGGKNINVCSADQLKYAALSAGWFWNSRNLNAVADKIDINTPIDKNNNLVEFKAITKKINGGFNGLADRIARYKNGVNFFK